MSSTPGSATCQLCDYGQVTSLLWASVPSSVKWGLTVKVRTADGSQWTALHRASAAGHGQLAAFLLQRGASPALPDGHGRTPLHRAAAAGHLPVVRTLLGRGAAVDPRDGLGLTPLHRAALGGHAQVAGLLLDRGAQPDAAAGPLRQTPLHLAARRGHVAVAELLLGRGASLAPRTRWGDAAADLAPDTALREALPCRWAGITSLYC
uniref:Uncharacterized protein n=1 Tax=Ornithorhynchus anatinus TaxID=9258 RepID=A0A6I8NP99_ORNAN